MQTLFVTGTDTNVGKTYVSCLLIRKLREAGLTVGAFKPVCSGAEIDQEGRPVWSDVEALRSAAGKTFPLNLVCPQRFLAAVAPNIAAELEGSVVSNELLLTGISAWDSKADALIIEGAGGVFCPLSNELTVLDLALHLHAPLVVVAANRLGVINHTRLTVERLYQDGLDVAAVVLNETQASDVTDSSLSTNAEQLSRWISNVPLLHVAFRGEVIRTMPHGQLPTNPLLVQVLRSS